MLTRHCEISDKFLLKIFFTCSLSPSNSRDRYLNNFWMSFDCTVKRYRKDSKSITKKDKPVHHKRRHEHHQQKPKQMHPRNHQKLNRQNLQVVAMDRTKKTGIWECLRRRGSHEEVADVEVKGGRSGVNNPIVTRWWYLAQLVALRLLLFLPTTRWVTKKSPGRSLLIIIWVEEWLSDWKS